MICYNCGCTLSEHDFCTSCRADVSQYKKIMYISNRFYNEGLEKAKVRDMSGSITALRQCLKFNKNNVEARNLLGLVYFETGEVVAALSEWVISQNIRPKKNIANDYIEMVQSNPTRLDTINQTIKKYNLALKYANQDSEDLAVINLKKVISLNPKFIRARQLLALLYINKDQWEDAKKQLIKCAEVDIGNITTQRYRKEVDDMLAPVDGARGGRKKQKNDDPVAYKSGNELVIVPPTNNSNKGASMVINIAVGVLIGVAVAWFLIMPARVSRASADSEAKIKEVNEQLDAKTADIEELKSSLESAQAQILAQNEELEAAALADGSSGSTYALIQAANEYLSVMNDELPDYNTMADYLDEVDVATLGEDSSEPPLQLYNSLLGLAGPELASGFYDAGYEAYSSGDYEVAIENLNRAYQYNTSNGDALYYLAQSYNHSGDEKNAIETYRKVVEEFPDTEKASKSEGYLEQLTGNAD